MTAARAAPFLFAILALAAAGARAENKASTGASGKPEPILASPTAPASEEHVDIVDQDLRSILVEFARRRNLTPLIKAAARRHIVNARLPLEPVAFLAAVQQRFGLVAYIDANRLVVEDQGAMVTRLLPLGPLNFAQFKARLDEAGIPVDLDGAKYLQKSNSVMLTAPAGILGRVAGVLDAEKSHGDESAIQIIRFGKYDN